MTPNAGPSVLSSEGPDSMPDSPGATDLERLAAAAVAGDADATDRLYAQTRPALLRIALAMGIDPDAAADLVQDTLWAAHRSLARFDPRRASLVGWMAMILTRRIRNERRARARRARFFGLWGRGSRTAEPTQRAVDARLTLTRLLRELTPRQREVIALYEIGGLSAAEVAGALGISAAGARSIARDARDKLSQAAATIDATENER